MIRLRVTAAHGLLTLDAAGHAPRAGETDEVNRACAAFSLMIETFVAALEAVGGWEVADKGQFESGLIRANWRIPGDPVRGRDGLVLVRNLELGTALLERAFPASIEWETNLAGWLGS